MKFADLVGKEISQKEYRPLIKEVTKDVTEKGEMKPFYITVKVHSVLQSATIDRNRFDNIINARADAGVSESELILRFADSAAFEDQIHILAISVKGQRILKLDLTGNYALPVGASEHLVKVIEKMPILLSVQFNHYQFTEKRGIPSRLTLLWMQRAITALSPICWLNKTMLFIIVAIIYRNPHINIMPYCILKQKLSILHPHPHFPRNQSRFNR